MQGYFILPIKNNDFLSRNYLTGLWQQPNYEVWPYADGTQRYRCQHLDCSAKTFMLDYRYKACGPGIKEQVADMGINGSGIRDTVRVLKINKNTVISTLKKSRPA